MTIVLCEFTDEDEEPRCVQLTNQHKTAIRFIRKVKHFITLYMRLLLFMTKTSKNMIDLGSKSNE